MSGVCVGGGRRGGAGGSRQGAKGSIGEDVRSLYSKVQVEQV